jgi:adenylate cyclase
LKQAVKVGLIFFVVAIFYYFHTFYLIENNLSDRLTKELREVEYDKIKILAIDEESLQEIGKWPWPRDILAQVAQNLLDHGAQAVFLDVLYSEASQNPEDDAAWQKVADQYDNIYLATYFEFQAKQAAVDQIQYKSINWPVISMNKEQIGHINVFPDRDQVVRRVILGVRDTQGEMIPAMSVRLANELLSPEKQISWNDQNNWYMGQQEIPINQRGEVAFSYATSPQGKEFEGFETFPIHYLIKEDIDPSYFQDSVVLIGPYSVGLQDMYYTPMSKSIPMFGVEIHANIVQSFLDGHIYSEVSKTTGLLILALISLISYLLMDRVKAKMAVVVLISLMITYIIVFYLVFKWQHQLLPYFYPLLAIIFAYITSLVSHYIREQRERNRVTGIFGRYVSKGVVDEILSSDQEIKLGGVRKDVTLMFVDIRGFTPLSEKMEPEDVINILNEYLDLCTKAVFTYEGTLDKFIGDGVMSIFGAPIEQEDHTLRAVKAALEMKSGSDGLAKRLQEQYGRTVSFGIGINSGPAVIGNIGSQDRLDYTAIGDTVNLAARLESNAKPGQILISKDTYERVKDDFIITPLESMKVKGKEQPIMVYQVEGERE